jgi:hypothetical protein
MLNKGIGKLKVIVKNYPKAYYKSREKVRIK